MKFRCDFHVGHILKHLHISEIYAHIKTCDLFQEEAYSFLPSVFLFLYLLVLQNMKSPCELHSIIFLTLTHVHIKVEEFKISAGK